jgi:sugar phosphate isomerase/epimerase
LANQGKVKSFSIFTKPWKDATVDELGAIVEGLGFNAIEFPLRPGYQVEPDNAKAELKPFAETLRRYGVSIASVASTTEEKIFEACAEAGVPCIRIMYGVNPELGYLKSESVWKKDIEGFIPLCERYGVKVGVQHHCGSMVNSTMEMRHLLRDYNPEYVGAIWDAAHSALAGEEPEQALDIIWDHLLFVNFKAAFYRRVNGPEAERARFEAYFTTGPNCAFPWERAVAYLCKRNYDREVCMPAEYTDEKNTLAYTKGDLAYLKGLFDQYGGA